MKIPKKLKVGGHSYKVILESDRAITSDDGHSCGRINRNKGIIAINKELMPTEQEATFFHEILHSINNELDETTVEAIAQQLYQVLKDNKLLKE